MLTDHQAVCTTQGDYGFRLQSGGFLLEFDQDQVTISRIGANKGLVFHTLEKAGLNIPQGIRERKVISGRNPAVQLQGVANWGKYSLSFKILPHHFMEAAALFHWQFTLTLTGDPPSTLPFPELRFFGRPEVEVYTQQAPMAAGLVYLGEAAILKATLFYFQDLTSLNDYFSFSHTAPLDDYFPAPYDLPSGIIGYKSGEFGLRLPGYGLAGLPVQTPLVVSAGYLALIPDLPVSETNLARRFLNCLADIYAQLDVPTTHLPDWNDLAQKTLLSLPDARNWVPAEGQEFLRAYVNDQQSSPELISQLDVLTSLRSYTRCFGETGLTRRLDEKLSASLEHFYDSRAGAMLNRFGQQQPLADSWYFITALVDLAQLARHEDVRARRLLFASVDKLIQVAARYQDTFPIFFDPIGHTYPDQPRLHPPQEYDVAGAYAYLMLDLYELSGDQVYWKEALAAADALSGHGFDLAYELHVTALAATACARLFHLTGDQAYLDLSLMPLANVFRHCWLWECNYGYARTYRTFFGLLPMTYATVITPKEQYESWQYLAEYLHWVSTAAVPATSLLSAEYYRHSLSTLRYAFPANLPAEALSPRPEIQKNVSSLAPELYIPVEDLRDGWRQSGNIAQELYGAGMALTFAAQSTRWLKPGLQVQSEYPILQATNEAITLGGSPAFQVQTRFSGAVKRVMDGKGQLIYRSGNAKGGLVYVQGGETLRFF